MLGLLSEIASWIVKVDAVGEMPKVRTSSAETPEADGADRFRPRSVLRLVLPQVRAGR